jgi:DNA-binding beta-propeller fold protein YncE
MVKLELRGPRGLVFDGSNRLYFSEGSSGAINVYDVAGDGGPVVLAGGVTGFADGTGTAARFNATMQMLIDGDFIYVADSNNDCIRRITRGGLVTTFAGICGVSGSTDGALDTATFYRPKGLAKHPDGSFIVADSWNHRIRRITSQGVTTIAGGVIGYLDGSAMYARFNNPLFLAISDDGIIYIADWVNSRIRKLENGAVQTIAGGLKGYKDGNGTSAQFAEPIGVYLYRDGNLLITDNSRVRVLQPDGQVITIAGAEPGMNDGAGKDARFNDLVGMAVDKDGSIYIADYGNSRIRKLAFKN